MSETLYRAYRAERNSGLAHSEIVAAGIFGNQAEEFALRYSGEISAYVDAMNRRNERDNIGDLDTFGRPLKAGT